MVLVVNKPSANAGDTREAGSIPGSGRALGGGHGIHSSVLTRRIQWTGCSPQGYKELDSTEATTHAHMRKKVYATKQHIK